MFSAISFKIFFAEKYDKFSFLQLKVK